VRRPLISFLTILILFGLVGLAGAELPQPISVGYSREFRPRTPSEIKSVEDAMAAIITVTSNDLGLPLVEPLYIHLHPDANSFAAYAGNYGNRLSDPLVRFAVAVASQNRFHVNMERVKNRSWSSLVWLFAHEHGHNIEYAFSSVHRGSQWLREGFADWVAAKVLHVLGWQDYELSVHRARLEVGRQRADLPTLSELEDMRGWSNWANDPKGSIFTYRLGFLAVARLMGNADVARMAKYFQTLNFEQNFGMSWRQFEKEFKSSVSANEPVAAPGKSDKPTWNVGDQWQYSWRLPGRQGKLVREVVRDEILNGHPVHVVKASDLESYYSKESLGLLATAQKGKIISKRSAPLEYFSWPVESGKEWKSSFFNETALQKSSQPTVFHTVAREIREISVAAGVFDTIKIEIYGAYNGQLVSEHWYAPKAKWFVKNRTYLVEGIREEELTSFKFK